MLIFLIFTSKIVFKSILYDAVCICWMAFLRPFEAIRTDSENLTGRFQKNNLREENTVNDFDERGPFYSRTSVLMVLLLAALRQN